MKVAFLINDITRSRGSERVAITLANTMVTSHQVFFISLNQENKQPFFIISECITMLQLSVAAKLNKLLKKGKEINFIAKCVKAYEFDVLVAVGTYPSILSGLISIGSGQSTKFVGWEHTNKSAVKSIFWSVMRKVTYRRLDGLVCLNHSDQADFTSYTQSVRTIANPLSFHSNRKATLNTKIILAVGAFEPEKGFDLLIQAFKGVAEKIPDWRLLLIGEGSMLLQLRKQIEENNLKDQVTIKCPVQNIEGEYLNASLYVLPSRREAFGMVLIEAMECGVPCISFDCPTGPRHLIENGKNGILVPAEDVEKLGEAIYQLINDRDKRQQLAVQGSLKAREYYPACIMEQWEKYLNELISR